MKTFDTALARLITSPASDSNVVYKWRQNTYLHLLIKRYTENEPGSQNFLASH